MDEFVDILCKKCGTSFKKIAREWRRQRKLGKAAFFCTPKCSHAGRVRKPKMPPAMIQVSCSLCSSKFERKKTLHTRQTAAGRTLFYCGKKCKAKAGSGRRSKTVRANKPKAYKNELSKFKWYVYRANARPQHGPHDLDAEYLQNLWGVQKGLCPFTGWPLILPLSCDGWANGNSPESASLDRIDNSLGYVRGNVRFVALMANLARQKFDDADLLRFAEAVHSHQYGVVA